MYSKFMREYKKEIMSTVDRTDKKAMKRALKQIESKKALSEKVKKAPKLKEAVISINWIKSRMYGHNPKATMSCDYERYVSEHIGGCGYDKESAAIASVLNQSPAILKILWTYEHKHGRKSAGYGSGYGKFPSFEGGVGVSCFEHIFSVCGYTMRKIAWTDSSDTYMITKAKKNK